MKKSHGRPKKLPSTFSKRREISDLCNKIAIIALDSEPPECTMILELALIRLLESFDKASREAVYTSAEVVLDAKNYAQQRNILTPAMTRALTKDIDMIQLGLVAQNVIDTFLEKANNYKLEESIRNNIIKTIVARLALELDANSLQEVTALLLPNVLMKKVDSETRHMYE